MTIDANSEAFKAAAAQVQATLTINLLRRHVLDNHIPRDEMPEWAAGLARAALEAYEAARPKAQTITGLPDTLPDGRKIVGWRRTGLEPSMGPVWVLTQWGLAKYGGGGVDGEHLIAITEPTDG